MNTGPAAAKPPRGGRQSLAALNDSDLLARFFREREDAAFATIVERHGPLVYGVCRRVLPDANDAEDAFQATFLVLVRKGAGLRDPGRLSSWLYGVAYRTARKLRSKAVLRTKTERQAGEMPTKSPVAEMTYEELQAVLDQEISQLPEKYSLPLVLCYLEGKTNAEAAAQLGWPEGSMSRRLSRARELLRSRLARRGLAMSIALITAAFARPTDAALPSALLASTTRAATLAAQGVELSELVSARVAKAVQETLAGMSLANKFAIPTAIVLASLLLVSSVAVWEFGSPIDFRSLVQSFRGEQTIHGLITTPAGGSVLSLENGATGGSCASACSPVTQVAAPCGAVQ
jgi:RNA polymerase sigma-70 factor (ECF subfamily)